MPFSGAGAQLNSYAAVFSIYSYLAQEWVEEVFFLAFCRLFSLKNWL